MFNQSFTEKKLLIFQKKIIIIKLGIFFAGIWKKILLFSKLRPTYFSIFQKFKKILHLAVFNWNSKKNIVIFKNQRPRICEAAKFGAKIKILKFEIKNIFIGCVGQQFWKTIVIFQISTRRIYLIAKFGAKIKILKFGTKNTLLAYF